MTSWYKPEEFYKTFTPSEETENKMNTLTEEELQQTIKLVVSQQQTINQLIGRVTALEENKMDNTIEEEFRRTAEEIQQKTIDHLIRREDIPETDQETRVRLR